MELEDKAEREEEERGGREEDDLEAMGCGEGVTLLSPEASLVVVVTQHRDAGRQTRADGGLYWRASRKAGIS